LTEPVTSKRMTNSSFLKLEAHKVIKVIKKTGYLTNKMFVLEMEFPLLSLHCEQI